MNTTKTKTALVTGGNRGIGFAICQGLLNAGFDVIIGSRSLEKGKAAANQLSLSNTKVDVLKLDVTDSVPSHRENTNFRNFHVRLRTEN